MIDTLGVILSILWYEENSHANYCICWIYFGLVVSIWIDEEVLMILSTILCYPENCNYGNLFSLLREANKWYLCKSYVTATAYRAILLIIVWYWNWNHWCHIILLFLRRTLWAYLQRQNEQLNFSYITSLNTLTISFFNISKQSSIESLRIKFHLQIRCATGHTLLHLGKKTQRLWSANQ